MFNWHMLLINAVRVMTDKSIILLVYVAFAE